MLAFNTLDWEFVKILTISSFCTIDKILYHFWQNTSLVRDNALMDRDPTYVPWLHFRLLNQVRLMVLSWYHPLLLSSYLLYQISATVHTSLQSIDGIPWHWLKCMAWYSRGRCYTSSEVSTPSTHFDHPSESSLDTVFYENTEMHRYPIYLCYLKIIIFFSVFVKAEDLFRHFRSCSYVKKIEYSGGITFCENDQIWLHQ